MPNLMEAAGACIGDIDYTHARGLSKPLTLDFASSHWVKGHQYIILTGPTAVGKELPGLCARPEGLPRRILRRAPPLLPALR